MIPLLRTGFGPCRCCTLTTFRRTLRVEWGQAQEKAAEDARSRKIDCLRNSREIFSNGHPGDIAAESRFSSSDRMSTSVMSKAKAPFSEDVEARLSRGQSRPVCALSLSYVNSELSSRNLWFGDSKLGRAARRNCRPREILKKQARQSIGLTSIRRPVLGVQLFAAWPMMSLT